MLKLVVSPSDKRFKIVHCAGYLKAWVPSSGDVERESDEEGCNLSCLVRTLFLFDHSCVL